MKYCFQVDENDLFEFNKYNLSRNPTITRRMRVRRIALTLIILGITILAVQSMSTPGSPYIYGAFFFMALAIFLFYKKLMYIPIKRRIRKKMATGRALTGTDITYEFLEDSYKETTRDSESTAKYSLIKKVASGKNAYYLYITDQAAQILPFRVFADDSEREEFYRFIQSKVTGTPEQK